MNISDLLAPETVIPALKAQNKKQLLPEWQRVRRCRPGCRKSASLKP